MKFEDRGQFEMRHDLLDLALFSSKLKYLYFRS